MSEPTYVAALHYAVLWDYQGQRFRFAEACFPVEIDLPDWHVTLNERTLVATPRQAWFADDQTARESLQPHLHGWAAQLELHHHLQMNLQFEFAETVKAATVAMSARATLSLRAAMADPGRGWEGHRIEAIIDRVDPPTGYVDSRVAREMRELCLRPMRLGQRPVPDAAYWLTSLLTEWATGDLTQAAETLNVSRSALERVKALAGRARQRKVASGSRDLDMDELLYLRRGVEELVQRVHLVESGQPPGPPINRGDWT